MEEVKCNQVATLSGGKWAKMHDIARRVYGLDGLAPTIHTVGGGNLEPKIMEEPIALDEQNNYIRADGTIGALTTDGSSPKHNNRVIEPIIKRKGIKTAEKHCQYCGKKLERKRYKARLEDFSVFLKRKFCDQKCMSLAFMEKEESGTSWYSEHRRARELKPKSPCEICGSTKNVEVHHKDGNWHNNNIDNLQNLCRSCHTKTHKGGDFANSSYRIRKLTPKECWR